MLNIVEDDTYRFDIEAANDPVRFIEKFCKHHKGQFAGSPFLLHEPTQKKIITDVYGWKHRNTGLRRFSQVWLEGAIGCGKSPLLAAIGIYELLAGDEPGAELYSVAANFSQARIVFDTAKRMIEMEPDLQHRLYPTQYEIRNLATNSFWRIVSGKGPKAGASPQGLFGDEVHEWTTRELYDSMQGRMSKRRQPISWMATNAGTSRQSLCWQLHEEALAVLDGTSKNNKLYPVIWCAANDAPIDDPATWKLANPLLNISLDEDKVRDEWKRAEGIPALEARFRRLYAGQWIQGSAKWLNLDLFEASMGTFTAEETKDHDLYVGIDGADGDDLFAVEHIYAGEKFFIDSHFYLPRPTAELYDKKNGTSYITWAANGDLTLLDSPTITPEYKRSVIAKQLIELHKIHKIKAVCYDRARVDDVIDELERAGITCVPVAQGYTVSPGCRELDRRLKEKSITIKHNDVLKMCAENVEVKTDDRGNIWPVKPQQKGQYAGTKAIKIDGIQALVTALSEARRHKFSSKSMFFASVG